MLKYDEGKIFIKDWLRLKPYNKQNPTDLYYLKVANDVKKAFIKFGGFGLPKEINNEDLVNSFSCFLTSYLEDVISKSGIWDTLFQEQNGKSMVEDIDFLLRFFKKERYHTQPAISLLKG